MKNALKHLDELYLSTMKINMALNNIYDEVRTNNVT